MEARKRAERRQALEDAKRVVRAYAREPSQANADAVEIAWRKVRQLDSPGAVAPDWNKQPDVTALVGTRGGRPVGQAQGRRRALSGCRARSAVSAAAW
jgi:hypothetical protein